MRVIHVVPSVDPAAGGPARSVPELCIAMAAKGLEVTLMTLGPVQPLEGVAVLALPPVRGTRQAPTYGAIRSLRDVVTTPDLLHVHSLWNLPVAVAVKSALAANVPYVITPRGMLQEVALGRHAIRKRIVYRLAVRSALAHACAIHFLSGAEEADSRRLVPNGVPTVMIPNGIDLDLAHTVARGNFRDRHGLGGKRLVLFVGRLHWSKNLELQLAAIRELVVDIPDIVWVLIGPDEGQWGSLRSAIDAADLAANVRWLGAMDRGEVLDAFADADVVLLTSRHEAHPMSMNEAMVVGAPMVMTHQMGFSHLDGRGAAVVDANPTAVAAAVRAILDDPGRAETMRVAGRSTARAEYGWDRVAGQMIAAYEAHCPSQG